MSRVIHSQHPSIPENAVRLRAAPDRCGLHIRSGHFRRGGVGPGSAFVPIKIGSRSVTCLLFGLFAFAGSVESVLGGTGGYRTRSEIRPPVLLRESGESPAYFSKFGDQVLRRSACVVRGRVVAVESATNHAEVVTIEVETTFKGEATTKVVVFANRGEYFDGSELLLFLDPLDGGPRFTCFNRISVTDADYAAKEKHLQEQLEIEALTTPEDRQRKSRELLLQNVRAEARWTRWNALRGLAYVLDKYPGMIRDEDYEELRKVAESSADEDFVKELTGLLQNHGHGPSPEPSRS